MKWWTLQHPTFPPHHLLLDEEVKCKHLVNFFSSFFPLFKLLAFVVVVLCRNPWLGNKTAGGSCQVRNVLICRARHATIF